MNHATLSQIRNVILNSGFEEHHVERFSRRYDLLGLHGYGKGAFDLLDSVRKYPPLLRQQPDRLNRNAENSARLLDVSKQALLTAGLRYPKILCNPARLNHNVETTAALLGVGRLVYLKACLRHPELFCRRPETMNGRAEAGAILLGVTKAEYVTAVHRHPRLLTLNLERLNAKAEAAAASLGMTRQALVKLFLKQPALLIMKSETLALKKSYVLAIKATIDDTRDFESFITNAPVALSCGTSRLHACYILAKLGLKSCGLGTLVVLPAIQAERLLVRHYSEQIARSGKGARTLQNLHALDIITTLPAGIPIRSRPHRDRAAPLRYPHAQIG